MFGADVTVDGRERIFFRRVVHEASQRLTTFITNLANLKDCKCETREMKWKTIRLNDRTSTDESAEFLAWNGSE